jgi:uncharacterized protein YdeI (YjbR/CyaY-like superfamily)
MASRPEFPADVAAAFERNPMARERFEALPAEQQADWLNWIDHGQPSTKLRTGSDLKTWLSRTGH